VKEDASVQSALQGVVFYPVQGDTAINAPAVKDFGVWAYPTFVVLDKTGQPIHRTMGFSDGAIWGAWLEGIKADPVALTERQARHAATPNFRDAFALGQDALSNKRCAEARRYFEQALALDPQAAIEQNVHMQIVRAVYQGLDTGETTLEQAGDATAQLLQSPDAKPAHILEACERLLGIVDKLGPETVAPYLEMAYPRLASLDDERLKERHQAFLIDYALYVENDPEKAVAAKRASLPNGWESDADQLNEMAWWCFERRVNLEEAEALARRGVELAPDNTARANLLDTLAEIVYLRGDAAQAAELIRQAVQANSTSQYLQNQLKRFTSPSGEES